MNYDFSKYNNGIDFVLKNNLTFDEAIEIIDQEIARLRREADAN